MVEAGIYSMPVGQSYYSTGSPRRQANTGSSNGTRKGTAVVKKPSSAPARVGSKGYEDVDIQKRGTARTHNEGSSSKSSARRKTEVPKLEPNLNLSPERVRHVLKRTFDKDERVDIRDKRSKNGAGISDIPDDLQPDEVFEYLDLEAPASEKINQVLLWSLKQSLRMKEAEMDALAADGTLSTDELMALRIAREIEEEMIRDLSSGKLDLQWYLENRSSLPRRREIKVPNPYNLANVDNLKEVEARIEVINEERQAWDNLITEAPKSAELDVDKFDEKWENETFVELKKVAPNLAVPGLPKFMEDMAKFLEDMENKSLVIEETVEEMESIGKLSEKFVGDQREKLARNRSKSMQRISQFQALKALAHFK